MRTRTGEAIGPQWGKPTTARHSASFFRAAVPNMSDPIKNQQLRLWGGSFFSAPPSIIAWIRAQAVKRARQDTKTGSSPGAPIHLSDRLALLRASSWAATLNVQGMAV